MALTPLTTISACQVTAPNITHGMSDDTLNALIMDATNQVIGDGFPEHVIIDGQELPIREEAARYFTLHLCSMDDKAAAGIESEQVDVLKRQYFSKNVLNQRWINSSVWGKLYHKLWKQYGSGDTFNFMVIEH